jgi:ferredoxin-NADP reductase
MIPFQRSDAMASAQVLREDFDVVSDRAKTEVRLMAIRYEAEGVSSFILRRVDGVPFPAVDPGAHVDIRLPNGMIRSFSLSNGVADEGDYRLTVARDSRSTGGSIFMHDRLKVGDVLTIVGPSNNFQLHLDGRFSAFIAGGIGITPFIPMLVALNRAGRPWRLIYCAKTRARAALLAEIQDLAASGQGELICRFSNETDGPAIDIPSVLAALPFGAQVYCCGPDRMLTSFRATAERLGLDPMRVHFEYFKNAVEVSSEGGFSVVLQRSGKQVFVAAGQTILEAIEDAGVNVPYSCREGVCGSCETKVISGVPDHRDMVCSEREHEEKKTMMICCSGVKSGQLTLDL